PFRRPARHLQVLQHGSGRRAGTDDVLEDCRRAAIRMRRDMSAKTIDVWGGIECTINRVGDVYADQLACVGHYDRLDDLDAIAAPGIRTVRFPVLWERVAPDGLADADWRWPDAALSRLRALGIEPIVGLVHHGSGPKGIDLLDPRFSDGLAAFAAVVA